MGFPILWHRIPNLLLKGDSDVSAATRKLVLKIAEELNYTTNLAGRALRTGRTGTIAVISGGLDQPYNAALVSLLDELLSANGYQVKLVLNPADLNTLFSSTQAAIVDGAIITGMHNVIDQFRTAGHRLTQPCVHICIVKLENEDCVQCNLVPAVEEALQTMITAGRKRIAYVGIGETTLSHSREIRTVTYLATMKQAHRVPEVIRASASYEVSGAQRVEILSHYFREHGCPDGILCVNDDVAMQCYRALMDVGCRIPQDVSLVGCDGLPAIAYFEPPLSTIAQPMEAMCSQAWDFLKARMVKPDIAPQYAEFEAKLVFRRSLIV
jgi:DNA-binding LacI/PurR family transcriptional regulator